MAWHQPQNYFDLMQLSCVMLWKKIQLAMSEIKDTQWNVQEYVIFNASPKMSHNFEVIHHYIVNL